MYIDVVCYLYVYVLAEFYLIKVVIIIKHFILFQPSSLDYNYYYSDEEVNRKGPMYDYAAYYDLEDYDLDQRIHDIGKNDEIFR